MFLHPLSIHCSSYSIYPSPGSSLSTSAHLHFSFFPDLLLSSFSHFLDLCFFCFSSPSIFSLFSFHLSVFLLFLILFLSFNILLYFLHIFLFLFCRFLPLFLPRLSIHYSFLSMSPCSSLSSSPIYQCSISSLFSSYLTLPFSFVFCFSFSSSSIYSPFFSFCK